MAPEFLETGAFAVLVVVADAIFTAIVVLLVSRGTRRRREAQALAQSQAALSAAMAGTAPIGGNTLEVRLAALDELRRGGAITEAEYAKARAGTLSHP